MVQRRTLRGPRDCYDWRVVRVIGWVGIVVLSCACSGCESSPPGHKGTGPREANPDAQGNAVPSVEPGAESSSHGPRGAGDAKGASVAAKVNASAGVDAPADAGASAGVKGSADAGDATGADSAGVEDPASPPVALEPVPVKFRAADGVVVHGVLHAIESTEPRPVVLLFHQAESNAAEYRPIAPKLQALGYHALAIDQRSGKRRFGRDNLTVEARGKSTKFGPAYRDLEAALAWAGEGGYSTVIAWGSSYSAALVFRLAAEHSDALAAVLSFSPGEYMGVDGKVAGWAREVTVPVFVTSAPGKEVDAARRLVEAVGGGAEQHVPSHGTHGSSTLHPSRNPRGTGRCGRRWRRSCSARCPEAPRHRRRTRSHSRVETSGDSMTRRSGEHRGRRAPAGRRVSPGVARSSREGRGRNAPIAHPPAQRLSCPSVEVFAGRRCTP